MAVRALQSPTAASDRRSRTSTQEGIRTTRATRPTQWDPAMLQGRSGLFLPSSLLHDVQGETAGRHASGRSGMGGAGGGAAGRQPLGASHQPRVEDEAVTNRGVVRDEFELLPLPKGVVLRDDPKRVPQTPWSPTSQASPDTVSSPWLNSQASIRQKRVEANDAVGRSAGHIDILRVVGSSNNILAAVRGQNGGTVTVDTIEQKLADLDDRTKDPRARTKDLRGSTETLRLRELPVGPEENKMVDFSGAYRCDESSELFHIRQSGFVVTVRSASVHDNLREGVVEAGRIKVAPMVGDLKNNVISWVCAQTSEKYVWTQHKKCSNCDYKVTGLYLDHCCEQCATHPDSHHHSCKKLRFFADDDIGEQLSNLFQLARRGFHPIHITPDSYAISSQIEVLKNRFVVQLDALGPTHTQTAQTLLSLGELYFKVGRLQEAEGALRQCRTIQAKVTGVDPLSLAVTHSMLGMLYKHLACERSVAGAQRKIHQRNSVLCFRAAISTLSKISGAVPSMQRNKGNDKETTMPHELVFLYSQLGMLEMSENERTSAVSHFTAAVNIIESNRDLLGDEHIIYAYMLLAIGRDLANNPRDGLLSDARDHLLKALKVRRDHVMPLWHTRLCLGVVSARMGHHDAQGYFEHAALEQRRFNDPQLAYSHFNMGLWHAAQGERKEATEQLQLAQEAVEEFHLQGGDLESRLKRALALLKDDKLKGRVHWELQQERERQRMLEKNVAQPDTFEYDASQESMMFMMPPEREADFKGHSLAFEDWVENGVPEDPAPEPPGEEEQPPDLPGGNCTIGCTIS